MKNAKESKPSRTMLDGMADAFTEALQVVGCYQWEGEALRVQLMQRARKLFPPDYVRYVARYAHAMLEDAEAAKTPGLTYCEWRHLVRTLNERTQLRELFGEDPDTHEAELRGRLLLEPGEMPTASRRPATIEADLCPEEAENLLECVQLVDEQFDGMADAYLECVRLIDEQLAGEELGRRIVQRLSAVWPADYREYRRRYETFSIIGGDTERLGPCLEYDEWCAMVDELDRAINRCHHRGPREEARVVDLSLKLLRVPGEPGPKIDS